ncbi:DUF2752 domain-containing protein [Kaistella haifensis]|nr:DUF2752 domain-containing protein [Kaistella haifensis]
MKYLQTKIFANENQSDNRLFMMIIKHLKLAVLILIFIGLGVVFYSFNPQNSIYFLKCPIYYFTGYLCPGCGSQRAIHELLHLNIKKAFEYNALFVTVTPYVILAIVLNTKPLRNYFPKTRKLFFNPQAILVLLGIAVVFSVYRNI